MPTAVYYVQCITGESSHVMEVVSGSELEQECIERNKAGHIGALTLDHDECPSCIAERRARRDALMCASSGRPCPFSSPFDERDPCAHGCKAVTSFGNIEDSPYDGQLRDLQVNT